MDQILFIGTESGYSLTWEEFEALLLQDNGLWHELAMDLVIEFSDGKTMWRECDFEWGCSNWVFQRPFNHPDNSVKPITILANNPWCPDELDTIQEQAIIKRDAEIEACESAAAAAVFETEVALVNHQRPIIHDLAGLTAVLK